MAFSQEKMADDGYGAVLLHTPPALDSPFGKWFALHGGDVPSARYPGGGVSQGIALQLPSQGQYNRLLLWLPTWGVLHDRLKFS